MGAFSSSSLLSSSRRLLRLKSACGHAKAYELVVVLVCVNRYVVPRTRQLVLQVLVLVLKPCQVPRRYSLEYRAPVPRILLISISKRYIKVLFRSLLHFSDVYVGKFLTPVRWSFGYIKIMHEIKRASNRRIKPFVHSGRAFWQKSGYDFGGDSSLYGNDLHRHVLLVFVLGVLRHQYRALHCAPMNYHITSFEEGDFVVGRDVGEGVL